MPHRLKQVNIRLRRADVPAAYREAEILGPSDVYDWMRELFPDTGRDYMVAANLDARGHPLNFMVANLQTVQRSMAEMIRNLMRSAILSNAVRVVLASRYVENDERRKEITDRFTREAYRIGQTFGINICDHLVMRNGTRGYDSYYDKGFFQSLESRVAEGDEGYAARAAENVDVCATNEECSNYTSITEDYPGMDTRVYFPDEFAYVHLVPVPGGLPSDVPVNSIAAARQAVMGFMGELDREYFCALSVNERNRPINFCVVAVGSATRSQVHFADSFKPALLSNAAKVVFFHNHPSGDPSPSSDDFQVTDKLVQCGCMLGIEVADHIIIGSTLREMPQQCFSFREGGMIADLTEKTKKQMSAIPGYSPAGKKRDKSLRTRRR
ncbi:MAG: JAB domain-containing protein [bacterium]